MVRRVMKRKGTQSVEHCTASAETIEDLRNFIRYALGDLHLSIWEENFLNSVKQRLQRNFASFTPKQEAKLAEIRAKLHYDQQHIPLPEIDPDGPVEEEDPEECFASDRQQDQFEEIDATEALFAEIYCSI